MHQNQNLMPILKYFLLSFSFLFELPINIAQNPYAISGAMVDEQGKGIELATVVLKNAIDSTIIASTYSEMNGNFYFNNLNENKYYILAQYPGYNDYTSPIITLDKSKLNTELPTIVMTTMASNLKEVVIAAKLPYIERRTDRTIVNVDALASNSGSNIIQVLERSPGISADQDGNIQLKGRSGVAIFVDDKPTYLSGQDLANYLKSLSADNIKRIEIMTNPPAKYEAAGNAGVINIVTKRNKLSGFNGNLVANLTRGKYTRSNNSINLNYNKKSFGMFANLNGSIHNSFQDLNINRYYTTTPLNPSSSFRQNSFIEKTTKPLTGKLGIDYYINSKSTLGLSVRGLINNGYNTTNNHANISNQQNLITQKVNALNLEDIVFKNQSYNINFRSNIDSLGSNITFDADLVQYESQHDQTFNNYLYDPNEILQYQDLINGNVPTDIKIYALKSDYSKNFSSGYKFEAGLKSAFTSTDNEAAYKNTIEGVTSIDYNLSNQFLYEEWIHAAYINGAKRFGNFDMQLGLRGETTLLRGNQLGNLIKPDTSFKRDYTALFPTFYLSWFNDSLQHHTLTFSYGRRIDRPFFQDLNPFISPLDKFTYYSGNANLLPTYAHNFSLTHSYQGKLNTTLSYSSTVDGINETLEIVEGIYYSRPGNVSKSQALSLSVETGLPITAWYNINGYLETGYLKYKSKIYTENLDTSGYYSYVSLSNNFQLGKGWNAEMRGDYHSDVVYAQLVIKSFGTLNFAFQKRIMNGLGNIKVAFNDILYTRRASGIINNLRQTKADWDSVLDTRSVSLSFTYKFGKNDNKKPKYSGNGSESEQNRVKS